MGCASTVQKNCLPGSCGSTVLQLGHCRQDLASNRVLFSLHRTSLAEVGPELGLLVGTPACAESIPWAAIGDFLTIGGRWSDEEHVIVGIDIRRWIVTPELKCCVPTTNLTPSPTNLLATDTPCFGSDTSSPCSRSSFCPRMLLGLVDVVDGLLVSVHELRAEGGIGGR